MNLARAAVVTLLLSWPTDPIAADPCAQPATYRLPYGVSSIKIKSLAGINTEAMAAAIAKWNACSGTVPTLKSNGNADIEFKFEFKNIRAPNNGGCAKLNLQAPFDDDRGVRVLNGDGEIFVYKEDADGRSCIENTDRVARTYAHEIGHLFGLRNSTETCFGRIMGVPQTTSDLTEVTTADCEAAADVTEEEAPGSPSGDDANVGNQCVEECGPTNTTPIVISLIDDRYELTSILGGVFFDLDADGSVDRTAWTAGGADDAFLVLDRNANGLIDDGSELFGDVTPQPPVEEPNGFLALAVFDTQPRGGDRDGYITANDEAYDRLRLWLDEDHDGINDPGELFTLPEAGIWFIDLSYGESRKVDDYGNEFRFWSMAGRSADTIPIWDVILLHL
ncbi:MAG: hypothetical protein AAF560_18735 [Acidobacteriota bacterium]